MNPETTNSPLPSPTVTTPKPAVVTSINVNVPTANPAKVRAPRQGKKQASSAAVAK